MSIKITPGTMQIQNKLVGRLSPDLVMKADKEDTFAFSVDSKTKSLILDGSGPNGGNRLKVWSSNGKGRSGYIGLKSVLRELGIKNPYNMIGLTFAAEVYGSKIKIMLDKGWRIDG